jgi:hypothetical protein
MMRTLGGWVIGLALAVTVHAGDATVGTFVYGSAEPTVSPAEARYAHLSFEFERCGAVVRTRWFDASHVLLAFDELQVPQARLARYRLWRPNIGQWADMKRDGTTLSIERHEGSAVRSVRLTVSEDVAAGPMLLLDAVDGRSQIESGNPVQVSYAVPEQMAAYDLNLSRMNAPAGSGAGVLVTASSWLIRQFMHPVEIYFDAQGTLTGMRGRVLPVMGTAARPEPMEADTRIERSESRSCSLRPLDEVALK